MKKFLSLFLALTISILSLSVTSFAEETSVSESFPMLISLENSTEICDYAAKVAPQHLHSLIFSGEFPGSINDYSIGTGFSIFNVNSQTTSTCFPLVYNGELFAILEVCENNGEYSSILSSSFAKELSAFFSNTTMEKFILLTDGIRLQAYDGYNAIEIYKLYDDGTNSQDFASNYPFDLMSRSQSTITLTFDDIINPSILTTLIMPKSPTEPISRIVNVRGVSQGNHPWCWAATCAALINYYTGTSLSASTVANYVFPDNPEQGGTWSDMKKAYNHWSLYPSEMGVISFASVRTKINDSSPMHLGLDGHSVGLIGYEDWYGAPGENDNRFLILLEPNGGVRKSVLLNSSGNFTYLLGGGDNAWKKTRYFS